MSEAKVLFFGEDLGEAYIDLLLNTNSTNPSPGFRGSICAGNPAG